MSFYFNFWIFYALILGLLLLLYFFLLLLLLFTLSRAEAVLLGGFATRAAIREGLLLHILVLLDLDLPTARSLDWKS